MALNARLREAKAAVMEARSGASSALRKKNALTGGVHMAVSVEEKNRWGAVGLLRG